MHTHNNNNLEESNGASLFCCRSETNGQSQTCWSACFIAAEQESKNPQVCRLGLADFKLVRSALGLFGFYSNSDDHEREPDVEQWPKHSFSADSFGREGASLLWLLTATQLGVSCKVT